MLKAKFLFLLKSGILGACFLRVVEMFKIKNTDIAGNLFVHFQLVLYHFPRVYNGISV